VQQSGRFEASFAEGPHFRRYNFFAERSLLKKKESWQLVHVRNQKTKNENKKIT